MATLYRPDTLRETALAHRLQIATLISDLSRLVNVLTADVEQEEMRAGVRNPTDQRVIQGSVSRQKPRQDYREKQPTYQIMAVWGL